MSLSNELSKLHILHKEGGLTDQEFLLAKERLIQAESPAPNRTPVRLRRRRQGAVMFGVCVGLAEATRWPAAIWRGIFMALVFAGGLGLLLYITYCFAVPLED